MTEEPWRKVQVAVYSWRPVGEDSCFVPRGQFHLSIVLIHVLPLPMNLVLFRHPRAAPVPTQIDIAILPGPLRVKLPRQ